MKKTNHLMEKKSAVKPKMATDFLALAEALLSGESERAAEITRKRFGLGFPKTYTLEQIGKEYGITRERVRQIVSDIVKRLKKKIQHPAFIQGEEKILLALKENNGIMKEKEMAELLGNENESQSNAIVFLGSLLSNIFIVEDRGIMEKAWATEEKIVAEARAVFKLAEKFLAQRKSLASKEIMAEAIAKELPEMEQSAIIIYLRVSSRIQKNAFGQWGLASWSEINPKGTRERIYLILKEKKTPLHFREIARLIDEYSLGKRQAHPQTVHNELIKDKRFVLIGRGIYALKEWGYEAGTIKEVIEGILKKAKKPLVKEDVLEAVMQVRKVKKATIMINLNNRKFFLKKDNLYQNK